jgi:hypothetical protein
MILIPLIRDVSVTDFSRQLGERGGTDVGVTLKFVTIGRPRGRTLFQLLSARAEAAGRDTLARLSIHRTGFTVNHSAIWASRGRAGIKISFTAKP